MTENIDYSDGDLTPLIEGDGNFRYEEDYEDAGYSKVHPDDAEKEEEEPVFNVFEDDDMEFGEMNDDYEE